MRWLIPTVLVLLSCPSVSYSLQPVHHSTENGKTLCLNQGGVITRQQRGDQSFYEVCVYEENRQCELKALSRGLCGKGGMRITGYVTEAARYCAITGGDYVVGGNSNTQQETGSCRRNGRTCDAWNYFNNTCELP